MHSTSSIPGLVVLALLAASSAACGSDDAPQPGAPAQEGVGGTAGADSGTADGTSDSDSGTGGQNSGGSSGAGDAGSGGCNNQYPLCEYKMDTEIDKQSFRQIAGYNCLTTHNGWEFVATQTCDYTEECDDDSGSEAVCVSCGPKGQQFGRRVVDGDVVEDCKGCSCSGGWNVYGCYADATLYGEPWADVVWQRGSEVIRLALLASGEVKGMSAPSKQVTIQSLQVNSVAIQPGGLVDFSIQAQVIYTDPYQQQHTWDMQARVVDFCN